MEEELKRWLYEKWADQAVKNLRRNCFEALYVPDGKEAAAYIMNLLPKEGLIGLGDSRTLHEIGVIEGLEKGAYRFLNPWKKGIGRPESLELRRKAFTCDLFLTGTNAVTLDGKLVCIDALGNRVAGMIFGPKKVIVVAGANKIVRNTEEAIARIKNISAPVNARKHNFDPSVRPPCGDTGVCSECKPPRRLCCNTVIIEGCSRDKERITVVIVGEELGY